LPKVTAVHNATTSAPVYFSIQQFVTLFRSIETLHRTTPNLTVPRDTKISGDGFPECPEHTCHADTLLQKGMDPYFGLMPTYSIETKTEFSQSTPVLTLTWCSHFQWFLGLVQWYS